MAGGASGAGSVDIAAHLLGIMRCHGVTSLKELVCVCVYSPQLVWSPSDAPHNHLFTFVVMGHRMCVVVCLVRVCHWSLNGPHWNCSLIEPKEVT